MTGPIEGGPALRPNGIPATAIILAKNEELAIREAVASVRRFNQIVVVDSKSTDGTQAIAKSAGAEIVDFEWNGRYPKKKQWSIEHPSIRYDWVFMVDADERAEPALIREIEQIFDAGAEEAFGAYETEIEYEFLGRRLKYGHKVRKRSLLNRMKCSFPVINDLSVSTMWEVEGHYQPTTKQKIGKLRERLIHSDPDPMFDYFQRHNRYSDWEVHVAIDPPSRKALRTARRASLLSPSSMLLRAIFFFAYSFLLRRGFMDGAAGLHYALAHSFYYWQVHVKAVDLERKRQ